MITDALTRLFTSRPVKLLLLLFILAAAATQAVPHMVDTNPYVDRLSEMVKQEMNATLLVKGGSHVQLVPRPALILKSVEIAQNDIAGSPTLTADIVEINLDMLSLVSGQPQASALRIAGVTLTAEKAANDKTQWGFLGLPLLKKFAAIKPARPLQFELFGGRISFPNLKEGETASYSNVQAAGVFGENAQFSGSLTYNTTPVNFSVSRQGTMGATPITLTLDTRNGSALSLKGSMDFTTDHPLITAKLEMTDADISDFVSTRKVDAPAETQTPQSPAGEAIPLKLTADYVQKEGLILVSNISLDALNSKATGRLEWGTIDEKDAHKLALDFSMLDADGARKLFNLYMLPAKNADGSMAPKGLVNKDFDLQLDITADQVKKGEQFWNKANFNGAIAGGVLTVNQLSVALPGESTITLFGLLSVSDTQGLRFEGNTEVAGKSLRDFLTVFDDSASNLPALGFGAFKLRSNLFISKELLRLSEADASFSELSFKGGLVAYLDKRPRIEAEVGLRDIDFDYFRNSWRENSNGNEDENFLRFDKDMNFDWLTKLAASIDFKVSVQGFNFLERKGDTASFRIFAQAGEIGIYNAKFNYATDVTEANLKLDVTSQQPKINLVLNTSSLNTNYFAKKPEAIEPEKPVVLKAAVTKPVKEAEPLPEMSMPDVTPEEDLRRKIEEEAGTLGLDTAAPENDAPTAAETPQPEEQAATPAVISAKPVPIIDAEKPYVPAQPVIPDTPIPGVDNSIPVELKPLTGGGDSLGGAPIPEDDTPVKNIIEPQAQLASSAKAQEVPPAAKPEEPEVKGESATRWSETPMDMSMIEGIGGNFDISVGRLQHKHLVFDNFKMLAKLERNLLTFQTLTFIHWGGSFSINGTIFGGKVPGLSLGFIVASADLQQMLGSLLNIRSIGGRGSISGTVDTSGVNLLSWVQQANAKMLFAGRGVSIQGFDIASVVSAVTASRTAADVFNNVNLSLVGGAGEYTADGAVNLSNGVLSTPGIALKTGRIVGSLTGDFRLIPWNVQIAGTFKFPELSADNVPSITVQWSGPVEHPTLQTDTQSLEAFVSKRIIGN